MKARETINDVCNVCNERDATIKCQQCQQHSLCLVCDDVIHDSCPFHDRMVNGSKILPLESFDPKEGITFKGFFS